MNEMLTERSGSILRVTLNRPAKKNAMTSSMYVTLADVFNECSEGRSCTRRALGCCRRLILRRQRYRRFSEEPAGRR